MRCCEHAACESSPVLRLRARPRQFRGRAGGGAVRRLTTCSREPGSAARGDCARAGDHRLDSRLVRLPGHRGRLVRQRRHHGKSHRAGCRPPGQAGRRDAGRHRLLQRPGALLHRENAAGAGLPRPAKSASWPATRSSVYRSPICEVWWQPIAPWASGPSAWWRAPAPPIPELWTRCRSWPRSAGLTIYGCTWMARMGPRR